MDIGTGVLVATLIGGGYMAWNIGANDVANAMGTSVGSGALTLKRAIVIAAVFEFLGAVLVGSHVTDTIRKGIVEVSLFAPTGPAGADGPLLLALGMLAALISAGAWLHVATHFALPVSTTHSIVGAVVGVGVATFGLAGVDWGTMLEIVLSWFASPALGAMIAFFAFVFIRRRILENDDPAAASRRIGPVLVGVVVTIIFLSFLYKALGNVIEAPPAALAFGISLALGVIGALVARPLIARADARPGRPYEHVERMFAVLQVATAVFVAFAHGANDVANAVGPLASVVTLARTGFTEIATTVPVPFWVLLLGGAGIVVGLATLGYGASASGGTGRVGVGNERRACRHAGDRGDRVVSRRNAMAEIRRCDDRFRAGDAVEAQRRCRTCRCDRDRRGYPPKEREKITRSIRTGARARADWRDCRAARATGRARAACRLVEASAGRRRCDRVLSRKDHVAAAPGPALRAHAAVCVVERPL
jgi:PiT family inorganic phosphate transporter